MITLRKMTTDEINEKPFLINQINDIYHRVDNSFFEYTYEGETRWLYSCGQHCTILAIDGEYIAYASFMLDDEYNLIFMEFDDFDVYRHIDGRLMVSGEKSNTADALSMMKRETLSPDDLNGIIMHQQINKSTGEEMVVAYLCAYRDSKIYFPFNFKKPFFIAFLKGNKKTKYLLYETTTEYYSYDIITIKEFGLIEFLKNGSYTLQKDDTIQRYFKTKHENRYGDCILLYPFSHPFKIGEMDEIIESKGFTRNVNSNVIGYFNGSFKEKDEFYALVDAIKIYDANIDDQKKRMLD